MIEEGAITVFRVDWIKLSEFPVIGSQDIYIYTYIHIGQLCRRGASWEVNRGVSHYSSCTFPLARRPSPDVKSL